MKTLFLTLCFCLPLLTFAQSDSLLASLENYQKYEMPNGLKILLVQTDKYSYLSYKFILDFDLFFQSPSVGDIEILAQSAGAEYNGKNQIYKEMISDNNAIDSLLEFMSAAMLRPKLEEVSINNFKKYKRNQIANSNKITDSILTNYTKIINYDKKHPYSEFKTEEDINNITINILKDIHNAIFIPQNAYLVIVGNAEMTEIIPFAQKYFGDWNTPPNVKNTYKIENIDTAKVLVIDNKDLTKTDLAITYPINYRIDDPEYISAETLKKIIFDKKGILYKNIVEDKKITSTYMSEMTTDFYSSTFKIQAKLENDKLQEFIEVFYENIKDLIKKPTEKEILNTAKESMLMDFEKSFIIPYNVATYAYNLDKYKLNKKIYTKYKETINALTGSDIQAAAIKYLKPDNANYILMADKEKIFCSLQNLAYYFEIDEYLTNMYQFEKLKLIYNKGFDAYTIINNYLTYNNAYKNFANITIYFDAKHFYKTDSSVLNVKILRKDEINYYLQTYIQTDSPTQLFHNLEICNSKRWLDSSYYHKAIEAADSVNYKVYRSFLFPEKYLDKIELSAILLCDQKLFESGFYKIKIFDNKNFELHHYFDIVNFQKVKTEKILNNKIVETIEYYDYKAFEDNVILPHKIIQYTDNYKVIFDITLIDTKKKIDPKMFKIKKPKE